MYSVKRNAYATALLVSAFTIACGVDDSNGASDSNTNPTTPPTDTSAPASATLNPSPAADQSPAVTPAASTTLQPSLAPSAVSPSAVSPSAVPPVASDSVSPALMPTDVSPESSVPGPVAPVGTQPNATDSSSPVLPDTTNSTVDTPASADADASTDTTASADTTDPETTTPDTVAAVAPTPSSDTSDGDTTAEVSPQPSDTPVPFLLGADISSIPEAVDSGARYVDTDGQTKPMIDLLKNHGFNAIRLRTFVEPSAEFGYAQGTGGSCQKAESYNDASHTAEFGAQVKAAGMQLLVDFHYSDTWADPGKQIIPAAWRNANSIEALADYVRGYTTETLNQLISAGARPDMVQVGNETTPGMLIHVPSSQTDCWGNNSTVSNGPNGQASNQNWDNLATLLKAGIEAVRAVDPTIEVVLHIENTDDLAGVRWWVDSAVSRGVNFDILGLSAYTAFQGQPSVWRNTLQTMASELPQLDFMIVEYNPERGEANRIVHDLPDGRGRGTFFWEPSQSGSWGDSMFSQSGNTYTAQSNDFAEYDALRQELGL